MMEKPKNIKKSFEIKKFLKTKKFRLRRQKNTINKK